MTSVKEYLISGDNYFPNTQASRTSVLPAGVYECGVTMEGAAYFEPVKITTDDIVEIPNSVTNEIVSEIENFWSSNVSEKFLNYGLVHKRGIILCGKPGTGKTITLAKAAKTVIEKFNGIVLFNPAPSLLTNFLRLIKDIEPNKKVMIIWEEFDSLLSGGSESALLSLLDGETQVGNIVYLATTNYISRIPSRIKNRPSRFARVIEVTEPDESSRRAFLEAKLIGDDKQYLEAMVQATEGFVIDQLKDVIISVCCFGYPISEAISKIKEMQEDSIGVDDYNEEQTRSVFGTTATNKNRPRPLQPLR